MYDEHYHWTCMTNTVKRLLFPLVKKWRPRDNSVIDGDEFNLLDLSEVRISNFRLKTEISEIVEMIWLGRDGSTGACGYIESIRWSTYTKSLCAKALDITCHQGILESRQEFRNHGFQGNFGSGLCVYHFIIFAP